MIPIIAGPLPTDSNDPRFEYPELNQENADRAWPCAICQTRRDEHADQADQSKFPELDIIDHKFELAYESNMFKHAYRELARLGEEPAAVAGYLRMIEVFIDMGHSGGSASVFIPTLNRLLQFQNLKPLTDDPDEWEHVAVERAGQPNLWQNRRCSEAFSNDGGKTYYLLSERTRTPANGLDGTSTSIPGPTHESEKHA